MKKVIIITGGSSGLGRQIAKQLSAQHRVIILSRNSDGKTLPSTAKKLGCDFYACDVSVYANVKAVVSAIVQKYKRIDCLVNAAGVWIEGPIEKSDPEEIRNTVNVNVTGVLYMTKAVVPQMKKQKSGQIIMINSGAGLHSKAERSTYTASKWAVTGATKALQHELHPYGIRVTGLYPGKMTPSMRVKGKKKQTWPALKISRLAEIIQYLVNFDSDIVFTGIELKHVKA